MIAPRVVGTDGINTGARRLERAPEVRHRKRRHFVLYTKLNGRLKEGVDRRADLREQTSLPADLRRMSVKAANLREKDLALHVYPHEGIRAGFN